MRTRVRGRVFALLLLPLAGCGTQHPAPADDMPATQPLPICYVGPIEVRVVNPDGSPAANIRLGLFGGLWYSEEGEDPPRWRGKPRTDEHGVHRRESIRECMWPTFFYAFDEKQKLAGFCVVERLPDLAKPQTVRLQPARWVTGEIGCPELEQRGEQLEFISAWLSPILNWPRLPRSLRYTQFPPLRIAAFPFSPAARRVPVGAALRPWHVAAWRPRSRAGR